jgi:hypothetical protein
MKKDQLGLCIKKSLKFFEKYKLGLDVVSHMGAIVLSYRPEKINKHVGAQILRVIVHNGHAYVINDNIKEFDLLKKERSFEMDSVKKLRVSDQYVIRKEKEKGKEAVFFIDELDDVVQHVKECKESKQRYIFNGDMIDILCKMRRATYEPQTLFKNGDIYGLTFKIAKKLCSIEKSDKSAEDEADIHLTCNTYGPYHEVENKLYRKILKPEYMSYYDTQTLEIENKYRMKPICENITGQEKEVNGIDFHKAHSYCLSLISKVPIFRIFDVYEKYDGHEIEDLTMYLVSSRVKEIEDLIMFPETITRMYGFKLKQAKALHRVVYFRRPSKIIEVNFSKVVEEHYKEIISENKDENSKLQKFILNKIAGLAEKRVNKKSITKVFDDYNEAAYYQSIYGGTIYTMANDKTEKKIEKDDINGDVETTYIVHGEKFYILEITKQADLTNGFRPIKEMIYDHLAILLRDLY